ncbi:hypothetical protein [Shewanella fidelis]|nr:hypothetical protein [Shewanella fidelis]
MSEFRAWKLEAWMKGWRLTKKKILSQRGINNNQRKYKKQHKQNQSK